MAVKHKKGKKKPVKVIFRGQAEQKLVLPFILLLANKYLSMIGFVDFIDQSVEWDKKHWKVSPGNLAKTVVLVTFLQIRASLYKIKDSFIGIDTEALFGEGVMLEHLNGYAIARALLDHIDDMTKRIKDLDNVIDNQMRGYEDAIKKIDEMSGIGKCSVEVIVSEIGTDMSHFPSDSHISSWSGLCPGNNESAGKRKNGKTTKGNKTLKSTLIQCAKSAIKNKESFFFTQYQRLVVRRGANRATVAVAHSMLIAIYHMLEENVPF